MALYYRSTTPDGDVWGEKPDSSEIPPGATLLTAEQYLAETTGFLAAAQASSDAADTAVEADAQARAQAIYDESSAAHPLLSLAVAQIVYPPFQP